VTLALVDGVFEPGITWADLIAVDPGKHLPFVVIIDDVDTNGGLNLRCHSREIHQSDAFVGVPVFRTELGQPHRSANLEGSIVRLGRLAGFEHNTTPYSLCRAHANVLYANVSAEDRRFLIGHKTNSEIYSHYHTAISTVNVQEIFRSVRANNDAEMHGLSLNRI
jgi:Protein of unknown function (DUF3435)